MEIRQRARRSLAGLATAVAVAGGGLAVSAGAAHAAIPTAPSILWNVKSDLCLGSGASALAGVQLRQWSCTYGADQIWTPATVSPGRYQVSNGDGLCLGVRGAAAGDGAAVEQETCNGSAGQQWQTRGGSVQVPYFTAQQLVNVNSGKCLGILGASAQAGAIAVQWGCNTSTDQRWNTTWYDGNMVDQNSGQCLGVLSAATTQGAAVVQWPCDTSADQVWKYDFTTRRMIDSNDGMCLGVFSASTAIGAQIVQWPCDTSADQVWAYNNAGQLINTNSGMCLGVPGASTAQGTQLVQWPCNNGPDQTWNVR